MEKKTLAEILQEELEAIQGLLKPGDMLIIEPKDIRLEVLPPGAPIALGAQAVAAILGFRERSRGAVKMLQGR